MSALSGAGNGGAGAGPTEQPLLDPTAGGGGVDHHHPDFTSMSGGISVNIPGLITSSAGGVGTGIGTASAGHHNATGGGGGLDPALFKTTHSTKFKTGLLKTWYNVFNDVLGISIVGLPSFFKLTGIGLGPVLMVVFMCGTIFSLTLQRDLILQHHMTSYTEMSYQAFGLVGYVYANFIIFLFNFPTVVQVLGSSLPDLLTNWFGEHVMFSRTAVVTIAIVVTAPISYYKSIGRFAYMSAVTTGCLTLVALGVIGRFFGTSAVHQVSQHAASEGGDAYDLAFSHSTWLQALGGISYAFTCNDLFMHAIHSLENPTPRRVTTIILGSQFTFLILGTMTGITGYLTWFRDVNDNILASYPVTDQFNNALKICVILAILFFSPYNLFMPRVALIAVVQIWKPDWIHPVKHPVTHLTINKRKRLWFHVSATTILVAMNLGVALAVDNLGAIFGFVGALSGISISLILPRTCVIGIAPNLPR